MNSYLNSLPAQDLDEAMPAYYASIKALDSLDKKSIQEMKSFTNPPQVIETCDVQTNLRV